MIYAHSCCCCQSASGAGEAKENPAAMPKPHREPHSSRASLLLPPLHCTEPRAMQTNPVTVAGSSESLRLLILPAWSPHILWGLEVNGWSSDILQVPSNPSFITHNITPNCKYSEAAPEALAFCNLPIQLVLFSKQQCRKKIFKTLKIPNYKNKYKMC